MELFKLLGTIAINNADANKALSETRKKAKETSETIGKGNEHTKSSNESTKASWTGLKSKINEYKAQGMSTSQAWRQATQDMKSSTEGASNGITTAFKRIGAAVATFLSVNAIKNFGLSCIQAAADVQAMESQFTQVFDDLEGNASQKLSAIADSAGISENRMKGSFTKIAAFAKTTGMHTDEALGLTERAMIATADSAAFYDRSLEETTESLQSFLKGNYENDAALGLSCTETTRNAAANELYGKSFKDLSESQKQLTLLKMVEDANKASGALGQAARESDTWTNVTGNLKQAWKDFQATIGTNILPNMVGVVKKLVGVIESWTAKMPALVEWCKEHSDTLKVIGILASTVAVAIGAYTLSLHASSIAAGIATAAASAFGAVMAFITSPVTLTVLAIGALVAAFVAAYNKGETFRNIVNKLKDSLVNGFNATKEAATTLKDKLTAAWDEISARCAPLISAIKENLVGAFNDLKSAGQGLVDRLGALREKFQPIADILGGALSSAASTASGWFDTLKTKVGDFATGALSWLNDKITAARDAFNAFADFAGRLWDNLDPLVTLIRDNLVNSLQNLSEPLSTIKDAFGRIGDTVTNNLIPALRDALMPIWVALKPVLLGVAAILGGAIATHLGSLVGVINGIVSAISGFAQAVSGVVEIVSGAFGLIVGIFTLDGEKIKESVISIKDGIVNVFAGLWDGVVGFVQGFVDGVVGFFQGLWDTLVGHSIVPDIIDGIVNCFGGLWDKVSGFVSGFVDGVVNFFTQLKDKASEIWNNIKTYASEKWESIKNTVSNKVSELKTKAVSLFASMKDNVSNAFSTIKSKITSSVSGAFSAVSEKFNAIKDKISNVMNSAKSKVHDAIENIKSKFNFSWSLPKLKLPHIGITGDFSINPPSVPKFSVSWYKKAMDNAMILDSPSIFGYSPKSGNFLGGGEAGSEVVAGSNTLMNMIQEAVATQNGALLDVLEKILKAIMAMDDNMGSNLRAALDGAALEINRREFGRIVREVT